MKKNLVSIIIIAKDEEEMLPGCLKTAKWALQNNEILVLDTGSTDETVSIAKKFGARVVEYTKGKNFSDWRNKAAGVAKGEWLFYVDADERIPTELKNEILNIAENDDKYSCYAVPRRNFILGKEFHHGGFWPDYQKRFIKKSALKKWKGELHEEPVFDGQLGHLKHPLIHEKHETISEMVEKTNLWSNFEGRLMYEAGHPPMNVIRFTTAMLREFWYRMVVKKAFLDGKEGIIFAVYQVFSRFVSYAKLWELQVTSESSSSRT